MPTDYSFRLGTYLALALSCVCLGYAEWDFLREATYLAVFVLITLIVSFRLEGKFELSLRAANRVGLVIGVIGILWLGYQYYNKNSLIYSLPWPASLLPYLGPVLMVLMPAKLFRPKHVGDWWAMQGIGLAAVGLAASLAEDYIFGILLALYGVVGIWAMTLFYFRRSAGTLTPAPKSDPGPMPTIVNWTRTGHGGRILLFRGIGWSVFALVIAAPLFFFTPRGDAPRWSFNKGTLETGFTGDLSVDMNRTGELRPNRDVAYDVRATNRDGTPKNDLNPYQRWRGLAYHAYDNGKWMRPPTGILAVRGAIVPLPEVVAPPLDLGPDSYTLHFQPRQRQSAPILADPVLWEVGSTPPAANDDARNTRSWIQQHDTSFAPIGIIRDERIIPYRQIVRPPQRMEDNDFSSPFEIAVPLPWALTDPNSPLHAYRSNRLPRIRTWTRELLERLARDSAPLQAALSRATDRIQYEIDPADYELVSRTISNYFATTNEFTYSLSLRQIDKTNDPVEDFLFRTKEGHCKRFAAALTLALRSLGIPCQYVLGFRGCEPIGDGLYEIRQDHAHAWVEVLIPRPVPSGFQINRAGTQPQEVWQWLSLDPTPGDSFEDTDNSNWLTAAGSTGIDLFLDYIVGYNAERRDRAVESAWDFLALWWPVGLGAILVLIAVLVFLRRLRMTLSKRTATLRFVNCPWFARYLRMIAQYESGSDPSRTPREQAIALSGQLEEHESTRTAAVIPVEIVDAYYRFRFAGITLQPHELEQINSSLDRLQTILQSGRGKTT